MSTREFEEIISSVAIKTKAVFGLSVPAIYSVLSLNVIPEVQKQRSQAASCVFLFVHQSDRWCCTVISLSHTCPHTYSS